MSFLKSKFYIHSHVEDFMSYYILLIKYSWHFILPVPCTFNVFLTPEQESLEENYFWKQKKSLLKTTIRCQKCFFTTISVVAGMTVAKGFSNYLDSCKSMPFFTTIFIVAKALSLQFLQPLLERNKVVPKPVAFLTTTLIVVKYQFFTTT